jgi:hypothetical protein
LLPRHEIRAELEEIRVRSGDVASEADVVILHRLLPLADDSAVLARRAGAAHYFVLRQNQSVVFTSSGRAM